jgi:hypothetical protein
MAHGLAYRDEAWEAAEARERMELVEIILMINCYYNKVQQRK